MSWRREAGLGPNFDLVDPAAERSVQRWVFLLGIGVAFGVSCLAGWLAAAVTPARGSGVSVVVDVRPPPSGTPPGSGKHRQGKQGRKHAPRG
jgi:hypothetical protein